MSKIRIECFGGEAELLSFESDGNYIADISFSEAYDGFISIENILTRVSRGVCALDTRLISDGEYEPTLILEHGTVKLPRLKKCAKLLRPAECDSDYVRRISLRERRLTERVKTLEAEILKISKSVFGTTIF